MLRGPALLALAIGPAVLAACGPIPLDQAERVCLTEARDATGPRARITAGVGTDGHDGYGFGGIEMSVSSDYLTGRDPSEIYARCVQRRSGQLPTRPYYEQPGWNGGRI